MTCARNSECFWRLWRREPAPADPTRLWGLPPPVVSKPGEPPLAQARFYADCVAQAAGAGTYDREPGADWLRFTCTDDPARRFYEGLAAWSDAIDSRLEDQGRSWRFTQKLERDPSGVDHCSTDSAGDYRCVVVLNVGEFLSWSGQVNVGQ